MTRPRQLGAPLSARELQVLHLAAAGLDYDLIARQLYVSPDTVKTHMRRIGQKLGTSGRRAVVVVARERGLLGGEPS